MPLSPEQRAANLTKIAVAAVATERITQVPAELSCAQCILESGWLEKAPGNNPFGIKARAGEPSVSFLTTERLTPAQLAKVRASGRRIESVAPLAEGKHVVKMVDAFAAFTDLTAAFAAYANLLVNGTHFKDRFARFLVHRNLAQLLSDMTGKDGRPPYATAKDYDAFVLALVGQANVQAALKAARSAPESARAAAGVPGSAV
jgi:flagellum-specific peptidoglycan hydrolase FlgJ